MSEEMRRARFVVAKLLADALRLSEGAKILRFVIGDERMTAADMQRSFTHKRPDPDTLPPTKR